MKYAKRILGDMKAVWMLLGVSVLLFIATPLFLTGPNLLNVLLAASITALLAIGQTYVIILGEIDLSVGSVLSLAGVTTALVMRTYGPIAGLGAGLAVGALCGLITGIFVTKFKMPSFIVTLAMLSMAAGLTLYITQGNPVSVKSASFLSIGQGSFLAIPTPVWIMLVTYVIFGILLARSRYGRYLYSTGDNIEAARLAGINVDSVKIRAFVICGMTAAIAAFILEARLGSAQPTAGKGMELAAIAAVIIGGTSLSGGRGVLVGTAIGALLLGVIDNGLNLLGVSPFLQDVVKGAVILLAVFLDRNSAAARNVLTSFKLGRQTTSSSTPPQSENLVAKT
ncbi:ABC transporter permease [Propionimicrobium sp. PCR01-08-3]|uniref:ABC transporter permease n=1 Tax=Propionimicrobium sp. PCR01-08-3 TaxID=3052086 RepID=UPI00255D13B3|nr:ABC transporter permease [Propionimicrobium sp. PCR01-08-3]WIY83490.1 ABC transporter permease [Propionimicrobium sp. PCR01-08-3]